MAREARATPRSSSTPRPGAAGRLPRGTLTEEMILTAALRLLDEQGLDAFSLPRLGQELGASSTAVYRHFASRDEIVLGVADLLIGESLDGFEPDESWQQTLHDLALRIWDTYQRHPAAASISFMRTTRRPHEMRAVDAILGAVLAAGWTGTEALVQYRGFASFVLSVAGAGAHFESLPEGERAGDLAAWPQVYGRLDTASHRHILALAPHFGAEIAHREIYERQVDLYLGAMAAQAPLS